MRMKNVMSLTVVVLLLFGAMSSCKKDGQIGIGSGDEAWRNVTFRIKPFEARVNPLMTNYYGNGPGGDPNWTQVSYGNVSPSESEQILYLWTFNNEDLKPDIGVDTSNAGISLLNMNGGSNNSYKNGVKFSTYEAGKAINITGADEITISMPVINVTEIAKIRFDASSSDTGPKDFSISYSFGSDGDYSIISEVNDLLSSTSQKTFEFDLNGIILLEEGFDSFHVKIKVKEGSQRPEGKTYNPNAGTFSIDNFAMYGVYPGPEIDPLGLGEGTILYHVFNAIDSSLVQAGQKSINSDQVLPELTFKLSDGEYFISFIANFSEEPLIFPTSLSKANEFFIYQKLLKKSAVVYGTLISELEIDADLNMDLEMERYFSEVNFEFTDTHGLTSVQKIEVENIQKTVYFPYSQPFDVGGDLTEQEEKLVFMPDFSTSNNIRFHHFLGKTPSPRSVSYKLKAFDANGDLLREVDVSAMVNNNVQLSFVGKLLESTGNINSGFSIKWKNEWRQPINIGF